MAGFGSFAPVGGAFGTMTPQEEGELPPSILDKIVSAIGSSVGKAAMVPGQVLNSPTPLTSGDMVAPATDMAMTLMGGSSPFGGVSKAGEVALGIVPVDAGRAFGIKSRIPDSDLFKRAVQNTPGASADAEALTLPLIRNQRPEQEMAESVRGGVFYLPEGSKDAKFYSGTGQNYAYGGNQTISGETAIKSPLFVKGATGGKAPEAALDSLYGKGSYQSMRTDALRAGGGYGLPPDLKAELISQFLEKHAPELVGQEYNILQNSRKGNQLAYALQEAAVASAARAHGHDAIVGYSTKRNPTKDPFISEVFDTRESHYPSPHGDYETWPADMFGSKVPK